MKSHKVISIFWLLIFVFAITALILPQAAQAQTCDPATGQSCPPSSGGVRKKKIASPLPPTPDLMGTLVGTYTAETLTAQAPVPATPCPLCPLPDIQPTVVAGPIFLLPGVINILIIIVLIGLLAGGLILVVRRFMVDGSVKTMVDGSVRNTVDGSVRNLVDGSVKPGDPNLSTLTRSPGQHDLDGDADQFH